MILVFCLVGLLHDLKSKIRSWYCINGGFSPSFFHHNSLTTWWGLRFVPYSSVFGWFSDAHLLKEDYFGMFWHFSWRKVLQLGFAYYFMVICKCFFCKTSWMNGCSLIFLHMFIICWLKTLGDKHTSRSLSHVPIERIFSH